MHGRNTSTDRVMVFVDGQNLHYQLEHNFGKRTRVHPALLARELAGDRTLVGVRYYSGVHSRDVNAGLREMTDRRHQFIRKTGVEVIERELMYSNKLVIDRRDGSARRRRPEGERFNARVFWHRQAHEKGIDLRLALDVVELALDGHFDVGVVVSCDTDLCELPLSVHRLTDRSAHDGVLPQRVSLEAAVIASTPAKVMDRYDLTHQVKAPAIVRSREDIDFARIGAGKLEVLACEIRSAARIAGAERGVRR
ncbi:MAG: NYN domain-containing protein [Acidimicrobiia bacterium]